MVERLGAVMVKGANYLVRWNDRDGNQKYDEGETITGVFEDKDADGQVDADGAVVDKADIATSARVQFLKQYGASTAPSSPAAQTTGPAAQPSSSPQVTTGGDTVRISSRQAGVIPAGGGPQREFNPFPCVGQVVLEGAQCDDEEELAADHPNYEFVKRYYEDNQDGSATLHCVIEAKVGPDDDGMCPEGTLYAEETPPPAQPAVSSRVNTGKETKAADPTDRYVAMVKKHTNVTMTVKGKKISYDGTNYYVNGAPKNESEFKSALRGE